ncbi:hypothetical protein GBAR_LOCUS18218 [Geodia barretti]|uniref:Uncharacterized protein n=1 Tax=Geodia barretti TaxID=519541 RepID=A0AA35SMI9_GEOBA|nr:hypothetical protein GBAR_LOCUS18218 [Geodia barretti]
MAFRMLSSSFRLLSRAGVRRASGESTYMSYEASTGSSVGLQRIKTLQKTFAETTGHEPDLYRFLPRDEAIYRVAMGMAIVGGATALVYLIRMAIGNVPPKRE